MVAVITAISINVVEDGLFSPSPLFLLMVVAQLTVAALLHPQEINCLFYGIIYYISVPSMYLVLIIFSVNNLNDITWGTREVRKKKIDAVIPLRICPSLTFNYILFFLYTFNINLLSSY